MFLDPYQPHDFVRWRQFRRVHSIKGWTFWCWYQGLIKKAPAPAKKICFRPSAQKPVFLLFVSVEWRFAMKTSKRQKKMFFIERKKEHLKDFICKTVRRLHFKISVQHTVQQHKHVQNVLLYLILIDLLNDCLTFRWPQPLVRIQSVRVNEHQIRII